MSATELTIETLAELGCLSTTADYVLDDESTLTLEFAKPVTFGGYGAQVTFDGKGWWVKTEQWSKTGELQRRWVITLEDEEGRKNRTPYLGRPDWRDKFPLRTPKVAKASVLMRAIGETWAEEDAMVPVPSLSGGESIGDIKKQILHWVQRNCPPARSTDPVGAVLRYGAPTASTRATGTIEMNGNTLPIGGVRSGFYVAEAPVKLAGNERVGAEGIAAAINAMNSGVTATSSGTRVNLTATTPGEAGNDIRIAVRAEEGAVDVSGETLTGGADEYTTEELVQGTPTVRRLTPLYEGAYTVTIGGRDYSFYKNEAGWPAEALAYAINADALADVTATTQEGAAVVTLSAKNEGAAGNAITIAKGEQSDYALSAATLTGGVDGVQGSLYIGLLGSAFWSSIRGYDIYIQKGGVETPVIFHTYSATSVNTPEKILAILNTALETNELNLRASADGDYIKIFETGTYGEDWTVRLHLYSSGYANQLGIGATKNTISYTQTAVHLSGGIAPAYATGWVDCCTGYITLGETRFSEPPSSYWSEWADAINDNPDYEAAVETDDTMRLVITHSRNGATEMPLDSSYWGGEGSSYTLGTDAEYIEVTIPAVAATGYFDLAETGQHPVYLHTGLFVNETEVQGAALTAAGVAAILNADTAYGVTATAEADGSIHLTAREAGAAGNEVSLYYNGETGVDVPSPNLEGGTLGEVAQIAQLWGQDGKAPNVSGTPRYDLLCPAAGTYGRYEIRIPSGSTLKQPGALAIYVPPRQLMGADNADFSAAVQEAAGQWMHVRGTAVPTGWSLEGGTVNPSHATKFWSSFPQFKPFKDLASYLQWGKLTFFPVEAEDAYPKEEDTGVPANYKELVDGNLYVLTSGQFPADPKQRNNPSGLHFCQGTLKQKVKLKGLPQTLPKGVKKEDILKIFSDAAKDDTDGGTIRACTLVLTAVFIDRRHKRYQTGTNADGDGGATPDEEENEQDADEATRSDYAYALRRYYDQHRKLYSDVQTEVVLNNIAPASLLGCQLVTEDGAEVTSPIRSVSMDYRTRHATIHAGSPDMLSIDEFLELRQLVRSSYRAAVAQATEAEPQTSRETEQRSDNVAPSISPSISTSVESAAAKITPFAVYRDEDKVYMNGGTISRGGKTATLMTTEIPSNMLRPGRSFGPKFVIVGGEARILIEYVDA